jgi:hypothetical protein
LISQNNANVYPVSELSNVTFRKFTNDLKTEVLTGCAELTAEWK